MLRVTTPPFRTAVAYVLRLCGATPFMLTPHSTCKYTRAHATLLARYELLYHIWQPVDQRKFTRKYITVKIVFSCAVVQSGIRVVCMVTQSQTGISGVLLICLMLQWACRVMSKGWIYFLLLLFAWYFRERLSGSTSIIRCRFTSFLLCSFALLLEVQ